MYLYVKLNLDANRFLPAESKDCMNSASYEYRNKSAMRGAQLAPMGMPIICWKTFLAKTTKMLSTRHSSILMMSSSAYLLFESECSFTKRVPRYKNQIFVSPISFFVKIGVSYNTCQSAFRFLVRNGCVKGRKIKGLDVCDKVEIWRFKMIYQKRLLLRCLHHFISDSINNMDHMRISGIETSSVILIQRK